MQVDHTEPAQVQPRQGGLRARLGRAVQPGGFGRNVMVLLSGTTIAQVIGIAVFPILTRIYDPTQLGIFALFMSVSALCTVAATGRYELAILLPKEDREARHVAAGATVISIASVCLILLIAILAGPKIAELLGSSGLAPWMKWVPLMVLLSALAQVFIYWSNREKQFRRIAINSITRTWTVAAGQLGLGLAKVGGGLIWGALLGNSVATATLGWRAWKSAAVTGGAIDAAGVRAGLQRYRRFPLFDIPSALLASVAVQIPVFMLSLFFGPVVLGFYALTQRVLLLPITLFANAVLGVFKQRATQDFNRTGNCRPIFLKCAALLALVAAPPFLLLFVFGPQLFAFVFGPQWRTAGEFARILSLMFFFKFISSPLSFVFFIREKQAFNLVWQAAVVTLAVSSFTLGASLGDAHTALTFFSVAYAVAYVIYLALSFRLAKVSHSPGASTGGTRADTESGTESSI